MGSTPSCASSSQSTVASKLQAEGRLKAGSIRLAVASRAGLGLGFIREGACTSVFRLSSEPDHIERVRIADALFAAQIAAVQDCSTGGPGRLAVCNFRGPAANLQAQRVVARGPGCSMERSRNRAGFWISSRLQLPSTQ